MADLVLFGTEGDDELINLTADDITAFGLTGNDTYIIFSLFGDMVVVEQPGGGIDTVQTDRASYTLPANVEHLRFIDLMGGGVFNGVGNSLNNRIEGESDNDTLDGAGGRDTLVGGDGSDDYIVDNALDSIVEGSGAPSGEDRVTARTSYVLPVNVEVLVLDGNGALNGTGNASSNSIQGTAGNNVLSGLAGSDQLTGNDGNDRLDGGAGFDNLTGDTGNDILLGGADSDILDGGEGNDNLAGGAGNDDMRGSLGKDALAGGLGNDEYNLLGDLDSNDVVVEAPGQGVDTVITDRLSYGLSANVEVLRSTATSGAILAGNPSNNSIYGSTDTDTLLGLGGNDYLNPGDDAELDNMHGGLGNDTYSVMDGDDLVFELLNQGTDTVLSQTEYALRDNVEHLVLLGTALNGWGNALANTLTGNAEANRLEGMAGNDTLNGGAGSDVLLGGEGNDSYILDADDVVIELSGQGTDSAVIGGSSFFVTYQMGLNLENLQVVSTEGWAIIGNDVGNRIVGNIGDDFLDGSIGNDTLVGGAGHDSYVVDAAGDIVTELANQGIDAITSTVSIVLPVNVEQLTLLGGALNATGNGLANLIFGNAQINAIDGGAGDDNLFGGAGNDTLTGGAGHDGLTGGAGADIMVGGAGDDFYFVDQLDSVTEALNAGFDGVASSAFSTTLWDNVEGLTLLDNTLATIGIGNTRDNSIFGNSRPNVLNGDAGNDILDGQAGSDTLSGGAGADRYNVDEEDTVVETDDPQADLISLRLMTTDYTLPVNVESLTILDWEGGTASGTAAGNSIRDNTRNNAAITMFGSGGADLLVGGAGNNTLIGGTEKDTLMGGAGDDAYQLSVGNGDLADVITETANQGTDQVNLDGDGTVDVTYTLGANVENIVLDNMAARNGTLRGNALSNFIQALDGSGAFFMDGGAGDDVLEVNSGVSEANNDTLVGGTGNDSLIGAFGNDSLNGGAGNDSLIGGGGMDTMVGGLGDDTYNVDTGDGAGPGLIEDLVSELANQGTDKVVTQTATYVLPANVENVQVQIPVAQDTMAGPYMYSVTGTDAANEFDLDGRALVTAAGLGGNDLFRIDAGLTVGTAPTTPTLTLFGGLGVDRAEIALNSNLTLSADSVETLDLTVNENGNLTGGTGIVGTTSIVVRGDSNLTLPAMAGSTAGGPVYRFEDYSGDVTLGVTNAGASDRLDLTLAHSQIGQLTVATELIRVNVTSGPGSTSALGVAGVNPALDSLTVSGSGSLVLTDMTSTKGNLVLDNYSGEQLDLNMTNPAGLQIVDIQLSASVVTELDVGGLGAGGDLLVFTAAAGSSSRLEFAGQDGTDQYQIAGSGNLILENVIADSIFPTAFTGSLKAQYSGQAVLFVGSNDNARYDVTGSGLDDTFTLSRALDSMDRIHGNGGADTLGANVTGLRLDGTLNINGALNINEVETINLSLDATPGSNAQLDWERVFGATLVNVTGGSETSFLQVVNATGAWLAFSFAGQLDIEGAQGMEVTGGLGNDIIRFVNSGEGTSVLNGREGNDTLDGGSGVSVFVFDTDLGTTGIDNIEDFDIDIGDVLALENSIFTALAAPGALSAANLFTTGGAIDGNDGDADDFVQYNTATGQLYYDSNGSTAGGLTQIAVVTFGTGVPLLTADDFVVT